MELHVLVVSVVLILGAGLPCLGLVRISLKWITDTVRNTEKAHLKRPRRHRAIHRRRKALIKGDL